MLGTSDPWLTSHLSQQTSVLYCRLSHFMLGSKENEWTHIHTYVHCTYLMIILSGERDTDPLVPNCQPVAKRESIKEEKKSSKAKFSNHSLPSSMFSLSDEEKLELKDVIVNMALVDIGFISADQLPNINKPTIS